MKEQIAYLAGIMDGEGTVALAKRSDRPSLKPTLHVGMTDLAVLELLRATFGGSVRPKKVSAEHHKPQWVWRVYNRMAVDCIKQMRPYLITKGEAADALLAYAAVNRKRGRPKA